MTKANTRLYFRHYIYIYLAIAVSTFLFFGWAIYGKVSNINKEFNQSASSVAFTEVKHGLEKTVSHITQLAMDITTWDEVHQQLSNPDYYTYWKAHRANTRELPAYIENIDLYNTKLEILGKTADPESLANITNTDNKYITSNNRLYYVAILPIQSRNNARAIDGYLLIRTNIIQALIESGQLAVTDLSSIRVTSQENPLIKTEEVMEYIQIGARPNPLFNELLKTTTSTLIIGSFLVLLFTLILYFIARFLISNPLSQLINYVETLQLETPAEDSNLTFRIHEFNDLKLSIDNYQQELTRIHYNLDKKNDELWKLAHHDPLTGAANRRAYEEDWQSYLSIADDKRFDFSYMLMDCDHFKAINDTYGHDTGDSLIAALANILQASLRDGDKLYRIGGDEFVTILWNTDAESADKIAQRCLQNIRSHSFNSLGINEPVTASIGLATRTKDSTTSMEALPRQADIAMYHAKKSGSRSIIHYNLNLETDIAPLVSNRIIDAVIKAADSAEGIALHYQPVVNAKTLKIDYYEALLRIRDKQGQLNAGDIFPVAEKLSLEAEIDLSVLAKVEHDLKNKLLPANTGVSINFSAALFSLPDLINRLIPLAQYLAEYSIIFEVTEKTLITDIKTVSLKLHELRQKGFQIALDDFGSGYSSIRYLASMPIDIVKFDISMTRQLAIEDKSRSIISGTAGVILKCGFKLVAEGIENTELQELVTNMGATHMQGYALGKPVTIDNILKPKT